MFRVERPEHVNKTFRLPLDLVQQLEQFAQKDDLPIPLLQRQKKRGLWISSPFRGRISLLSRQVCVFPFDIDGKTLGWYNTAIDLRSCREMAAQALYPPPFGKAGERGAYHMGNTIIKTEDLHFSYPAVEGGASPVVLDGVDLGIEEGAFVAVLGHNGSGKSTLAKHMNAILLPSGGRIYVDGIDTAEDERLLDIRRTVGMVFQNPDNQIVANVVEEDVAFAPENLGVPPEEIRQRVDDALKAVDMYDYREHAPHLLSGGQKQRVAIAGVIAMQPRCIVLDEPTAMLDPIGRKDVLRTIKTLNRERGVTVVLITHHMDEAAQADRLIVMAKGKVVADGAPKSVFSQVEELRQVGLTVPQTTALLWELRQEGFDVPLDALSDEECAQALYRLLQ